MSDKSRKNKKFKPTQQEMFDLYNVPLAKDETFMGVEEAVHYVCAKFGIAKSTFHYYGWGVALMKEPFGTNPNTGKPGLFKCRKSQVDYAIEMIAKRDFPLRKPEQSQ